MMGFFKKSRWHCSALGSKILASGPVQTNTGISSVSEKKKKCIICICLFETKIKYIIWVYG